MTTQSNWNYRSYLKIISEWKIFTLWPIFISLLHPHFKAHRHLIVTKEKEDDFCLFKIHCCKIVLHDYWLNSFHFLPLQRLTQKKKNRQVSLVLGSPTVALAIIRFLRRGEKKSTTFSEMQPLKSECIEWRRENFPPSRILFRVKK